MKIVPRLILGIGLIGILTTSANAESNAILFTQPELGSCLAGDSVVPINWTTSNPGPDLVALAFSPTGEEADSYQTKPSDYFATDLPNTGTYSWTVPKLNITTGRLTAEGYSSNGTIWGRGLSQLFGIDSSPPTKPLVTVTAKTETGVTLSWPNATDLGCATFLGYKLYQDGELLQMLTPATTTVTLNHLAPTRTYVFTVVAYDALMATSSEKLTVHLTTMTSPSPSPGPSASASPGVLTKPTPFSEVTIGEITPSSATITFFSDQERDVVIDFGPTQKYGQNKSVTKKLSGTTWTFSVNLTDLTEDTTYNFRLRTKTVKSENWQFKTTVAPVVPAAIATISSVKIGEEILNQQSSAKVVETEKITVAGQTQPKTKVYITVHSTPKTFEVISDDTGLWKINLDTKGLEGGKHEVILTTKDSKGKASTPIPVITFNLVPKAKAASQTYIVPNATQATQFGKWYGQAFLSLTGIGTVILIVMSHLSTRKPHLN